MEIKSAWKQLLQLGGHSYLCTGAQHSRGRGPVLPVRSRHPGESLGEFGGVQYSRGAAAVSLLLCLLLTFPSALWLLWAFFLFKEFA